MKTVSKLVRWVEHLTDGQVVLLAVAMSRALGENGDVEPEQLRGILTRFITNVPAWR